MLMYCMKLRNYIAGQFKKRRPIELHFDVLICANTPYSKQTKNKFLEKSTGATDTINVP